MPLSTADKLKIKEEFTLLTIHAPKTFKNTLGKLPPKVNIIASGREYDQVHWFVADKKQLSAELKKTTKLIRDQVVCWIYYPKGTSGIQTDLTRDKGWDDLLKDDRFQWLSLISFDETWSTFAIRLKNDADKKKEATKPEREIFNYADPVTKKVTIPEDLAIEFKKHKKEEALFQSLAFTHKKEYIEWIVTAKKPETRAVRIKGTIERLAAKSLKR